uniref:Chromosome 8 open reading frame 74 n=1 Tax=Pongo abelii TaxID=9601 RepID=A0A8I5YUX7_PONAB
MVSAWGTHPALHSGQPLPEEPGHGDPRLTRDQDSCQQHIPNTQKPLRTPGHRTGGAGPQRPQGREHLRRLLNWEEFDEQRDSRRSILLDTLYESIIFAVGKGFPWVEVAQVVKFTEELLRETKGVGEPCLPGSPHPDGAPAGAAVAPDPEHIRHLGPEASEEDSEPQRPHPYPTPHHQPRKPGGSPEAPKSEQRKESEGKEVEGPNCHTRLTGDQPPIAMSLAAR